MQLFDRSYQPIQLTPEGRAMLPHAEAFLHQLEFLSQAADSLSDVRGTVRVGLYPSVSCWLFPRLLPLIGRLYPHVRLVLWEGQSADLSEALITGAIDVAVRPLVPLVGSGRLNYQVLWREPLVAIVAPHHPLARRPTVAPAELARYELVTVGGPEPLTTHLFEAELAFAQAGIRHTIAHQTNQPQTLINLARLGGFVGVTNMLSAQTADHVGVAILPIEGEVFTRTVGLWHRTDGAMSPSVQAVHDAVMRIGSPDFGYEAVGVGWKPTPGDQEPTGSDGPAE
ncbi:MAG: LysR family transcriptional regulator substrate-binding protein [Micrococcales bacterium]|nr:LysR family transcriptional regulator substrate-binding protein [Micrococcales bacterium]